MEIADICNSKRCQTVAYLGDKAKMFRFFRSLLEVGIKGIDRIVPIGRTMDFDFLWDGYHLYERMTRIISNL